MPRYGLLWERSLIFRFRLPRPTKSILYFAQCRFKTYESPWTKKQGFQKDFSSRWFFPFYSTRAGPGSSSAWLCSSCNFHARGKADKRLIMACDLSSHHHYHPSRRCSYRSLSFPILFLKVVLDAARPWPTNNWRKLCMFVERLSVYRILQVSLKLVATRSCNLLKASPFTPNSLRPA